MGWSRFLRVAAIVTAHQRVPTAEAEQPERCRVAWPKIR